MLAPCRQMLIQQRDESIVVMGLQQMQQLVHDDVFKALHGFLGQLEIQPDAAGTCIAAAPARLHPLDPPAGGLHAKLILPPVEQRRDQGFIKNFDRMLYDISFFIQKIPDPKKIDE